MMGLLRSLMKRPEHRATSANLGAIYPFVAQGGLGGRGVLIGYDHSGGAFCYDPWIQYGKTITGPNMIVMGIVGRAKSSLIKTYLYRQAVFGRRHLIIDPKGEYSPLARELGCTPIVLKPGGDVRLNPLSSHAGEQSQLRLLVAVASAAIGRDLTPTEAMVCAETLATFHEPGEAEATLPRVVERLLDPREQIAERMRLTTMELLDHSKDLAYGLARLCRGDLAGMFDGETTAGIDLDAPSLVLDLHHVVDSAAIGIIIVCAAAWLRSAIAAETAEVDPAKRPQRIVVFEEAWRVLANLAAAEWLVDSFKHSRSYGVQNVVVTHRISDLQATGDDGSRVSRLTQGLISDAETKVIYAQDKAELDTAERLLGLTDTEAAELPTLPRGLALWLVGERSFLVRHVLSEHEVGLVDTDARMRTVQTFDDLEPSELEQAA
jgi:type IV secretory pathway VirB4 component